MIQYLTPSRGHVTRRSRDPVAGVTRGHLPPETGIVAGQSVAGGDPFTGVTRGQVTNAELTPRPLPIRGSGRGQGSVGAPEWLAEEIIAGARAAGRSHCRDCDAPVWTGLDADMCALVVTLDPAPLDSAGEALVLATGGASYELWHAGGRSEIVHRGPGRWCWRTADASSKAVLAGHVCGRARPLVIIPTHRKERPDAPPW
jgi:hypothetical protein